MSERYSTDESFALDADRADPLADCRSLFHVPLRPDGQPVIYFCGHSLGLQPKSVRGLIDQELEEWARRGVEGHFLSTFPWFSYHELFREPLAALVGARPGEVVAMNSLTVNLHLMLETFYRPRPGRALILADAPLFPSDLYALQSQLRRHGFDPRQMLRVLKPRPGEQVLRMEDIEQELETHGQEIALVLWNGVQFFTGQAFDLARVTAAARRQGCVVGLDLAHAVGNIELQLHDWNVDFAVWCSYKYLNAGPGAVGGCFVHEQHGQEPTLPRLAGWWGNDPATRFQMPVEFVPRPGAEGWQISNPPIFALAPLRASLALFEQAGLARLRDKSQRLTGYLRFLLDQSPSGRFEIITPREPAGHGCQLSILVHDQPRALLERLEQQGILADFREPNIIRVAPVPLYNTFHEVWQFARILEPAAQARV